jgi:integrase
VPIERISEWAGHSSVQVTMDHYLHLMPEDKLGTLDVIESMALDKTRSTLNGHGTINMEGSRTNVRPVPPIYQQPSIPLP